MNEDFFDWLDKCPTEWYLQENDKEGRVYYFVDNEQETEEWINAVMMNKIKWRITCINHGISKEYETDDLNKYFKWAGIDKEGYGEDLFKVELIQ